MDLVSPHQIKSPYIAAQFTAYVGIFCIKLAILFIAQQQMYWKFMSNETLLETNVQNKKPVPDIRDWSKFYGDPGQSRTGDLPLRRRLLYPAELRNHEL